MTPSLNHSYLCRRIIVELEKTGKWEAWPELTLDIGAGLIPDLAVYKRGTIRPNFHEDSTKCAVLPQLVIEVASPSQSIHELMQKAERFLKEGIAAVWTIEPYGQLVYVSRPGSRKVELTGQVSSEGVSVNFSDIFGSDEKQV
ncbi:MAG: Uma2 family endonuclease [Candidatus Electrothrix aestuarii]|uniref:Uma2 family endonuclease n=1 Tax=Candidatus Electrothrix aestuarii TaxID=3062594 RepID=A0AAU8LXK0_9BACT|nr:Uma2 family endonuclease [Candidatus Electrothrix aestuarii]